MLGIIEFEIENEKDWFGKHIIKVGYDAVVTVDRTKIVYYHLSTTKNLLVTYDLEETELKSLELRWGEDAVINVQVFTEQDHPHGIHIQSSVNWIKLNKESLYNRENHL